MQLDFPNYTVSQMGYGNYAYGFLLGYRFKFDTNAIAKGNDQNSHYIGVKYFHQEIFPNSEYYADGETCTSCDELAGIPKITSLDWSSEEFHLIYAGNSAYIGIGMVDARFMIQGQAEHEDMPGLIIADGEIDQQVKTSVLTLGLMKQSGNFSFDLYGRVYPPSKVFQEVSFSVGAGLAFQFFFLR